jgi:hypothetical protein
MRNPIAAILSLLILGACSAGTPPSFGSLDPVARPGCATKEARIAFDFEGASLSRCVIHGPREFSVLVSPEHAPPINPSPWYAFRYEAQPGPELTVHLRYLSGRHRYSPYWTNGATQRRLTAKVSPDGTIAALTLPSARATVSGQPVLDSAHNRRAIQRWARQAGTSPFVVGHSHGNRPITALRIGRADAPGLILLLGRQHPPEVTGAIAMEGFVDRIAAMIADNPELATRYQFVVFPQLNPDGVALGHWRANLGGTDLNRDWGTFSQPETQAVKRWLDTLPKTVRPVLMLDFHSTQRNLFYVQGDEAGERENRFLAAWLGGKEAALPGYPFTIERRDANPGSGTTKNWFHATYGIPAYTYEAGDNSDPEAVRGAAEALAATLPAALEQLR